MGHCLMSLSRRHFVLAAFGAMAAGCAEHTTSLTPRPRTQWPTLKRRPAPLVTSTANPRTITSATRPPAGNTLGATARSHWARGAPIRSRLNRMGNIQRITIHHEGFRIVDFTDIASTAERLELIRRSHLNRMRAGDIGYHYIIDRSGRLWEGRDIRYQGAHVRNNNPHNIGVMVLGNFDLQQPTGAQMQTLRLTVGKLMHQHHVALGRVYTHQEITPTACPGKGLQPRVAALRSNRQFG